MSPMYSLVKEMNIAFGNPEGDPKILEFDAACNVKTSEAWKRLEKQCLNIKAEYYELIESIEAGKPDDVRDALCDIMVFTLGAYHFMGYDADEDMEAVLSAVMTRFCKNEEQLKDTINHFADKGIVFTINGEFPRVYLKSAHDQGYNAEDKVYEYPKGKFLKSVGYRKPVFARAITVQEQTPLL